MQHIYGGVLIRSSYYHEHPDLYDALEEYMNYMIDEGYFPYGYDIYRVYDGTYVLLDFSNFGTVSNMQVRFKKYKAPMYLGLAHAHFGLVSFGTFHDWELLSSEKIEIV